MLRSEQCFIPEQWNGLDEQAVRFVLVRLHSSRENRRSNHRLAIDQLPTRGPMQSEEWKVLLMVVVRQVDLVFEEFPVQQMQ